MSGQQQVTDEGTRPGKSHNAASESKLNSTLLTGGGALKGGREEKNAKGRGCRA